MKGGSLMRVSPGRRVSLVLMGFSLGLLLLVFAERALPASAAPVTATIVEPSDDPDSWTYDPQTLTVNVGDTVTWVNNGGDVHTVTGDGGSFDSDDLKHGASWSYTFTAPGTYTYYCVPHPWMTATVVVNG
jgi:plastocyanin